MIVTFCGHSKMYQTGDFSKWLDIILPSLIEAKAGETGKQTVKVSIAAEVEGGHRLDK